MKEAIDIKYEKLKDQFSTPTRNVRRNLLISASVLITMLILGTEINSLFGLKFKDNIPIEVPIGALSIVVMYELLTFISYAVTDFKAWKLKPYEKTYQFTEEKLTQITHALNSAIKDLNLKALDSFKSIPSTNQVKLEIHSFPYGPLIDPVIFQDELQSDLENNTPVINPAHRKIEEKFRNEIEKNGEAFLNNIISEKTDELNVLVEAEKNSYFAKLNSHLSDAQKDIQSNSNSVISATKEMSEFILNFEKNIGDYYSGIKSFNFFQWIKIYPVDIGIPLLLGIFSLYLTYESTIIFLKKLLSLAIKP